MDFRAPLSFGFLLGFATLRLGPGARAATLQEIIAEASPTVLPAQPLYPGAIPNSRPTADAEVHQNTPFGESITAVSRPTYTAYLPGRIKATGAAVIVLPGGGYRGLMFGMEGTVPAQYFNEHGIAAIVLKYRLPSPQTMIDPSIGPLQDAQRTIQIVRQHAKAWGIDPHKVGIMGFSAGGHLAGTAITQFHHAYIDNPQGISLRPDFAVLVYPVVTMEPPAAHAGSRDALLGLHPLPELVERFSVEKQVSSDTPPALILAASDDDLVPVENSLALYAALHRHGVPASLHLFVRGEHGFFLLPREEWQAEIWSWLKTTGVTP
jgi:acetyl esterase/lipase